MAADGREQEQDDDAHEHDHGTLTFQRSEIDEVTLGSLRPLHPDLADALIYARKFGDLTVADKSLLEEAQRKVEAFQGWTPGFHAPGDRCRTCAMPVAAIFTDRFEQGTLPFAAFIEDVPVHARKECIQGFQRAKSPQARDALRREFTVERARPSALMTQYFRADVFTHPPFGLEDWANSVSEANAGKLEKPVMKDIERLMGWVHRRLFHGA